MMLDARFTLAGLVVGTLVGISGVGGGSLLAPLLIGVFGVKAAVAVGTDLVYSVPMKTLAAIAHFRQGTVDRRIAGALALGGIPGALVGLAVFAFVHAHFGPHAADVAVRRTIGIVILASAAATAFVWLLPRRSDDRPVSIVRVAGLGAGVGAMVAITSVGSGALTLPLLLLAAPGMPLRRAIGSDIVFAALLIPVAAAGHAALGNVNWQMALSLAVGAVPGAWLGSKLCGSVGERALRPAVIGLLALAGVKLL